MRTKKNKKQTLNTTELFYGKRNERNNEKERRIKKKRIFKYMISSIVVNKKEK